MNKDKLILQVAMEEIYRLTADNIALRAQIQAITIQQKEGEINEKRDSHN
ncbi:hypothetical protein OMD49_06575 [Bacillus anthracis]|nr:hypothetical protein [Bacillus anthracis]